jgi:transcriptional regulator GlxA family with amidase domain
MMIERIESALSMLRTDLVQRFAEGDWDEGQAQQAALAVVACLRPAHVPSGNGRAGNAKLPYAALRRTLRYINDNLDSKLTWHEIAARVDVGTFGFGRSFKLSTGMTPHQYVIRCRVRRAMKLLARERPSIADIALEVGCSCQSHLTTLFRKYTGTTPGAFRSAARVSRGLLEATASGFPLRRFRQPAEPAAVEIRDRTHNLVLGVHHERSMEHDRLVDRLSTEHQ